MIKKLLSFVVLFATLPFLHAQYTQKVFFDTGFVGITDGNQVGASSCYTLSTMGITNLTFHQNSSSSTSFDTSGADVVGYIVFKDKSNVERTVTGRAKWRYPGGGGTITTIGFIPDASITFDTNLVAGSSTYTLDATKSVGMVFIGQTLTFTEPGVIGGSSAGVATALNDYLTFTKTTLNTKIETALGKTGLRVVQNPVKNGVVTLDFSNASNGVITIFDSSGKSLKSVSLKKENGSETIDVSGFSKGLYWVKLQSDKEIQPLKC